MKKVIITIIVTLCAVSVFGAENNNPREIFILNTTRGIEKGFDLAKKRLTPEQREKLHKAAETYADKVVAYVKSQGVYAEWARQLTDPKNIEYNYSALVATDIEELMDISAHQLDYIARTYPKMWEKLVKPESEKIANEFQNQIKEIVK